MSKIGNFFLIFGILWLGIYFWVRAAYPVPSGFISMTEFINEKYADPRGHLDDPIGSEDARGKLVISNFIQKNECKEKNRTLNQFGPLWSNTIEYSCDNGNFYVRLNLTNEEKDELKNSLMQKAIDRIDKESESLSGGQR